MIENIFRQLREMARNGDVRPSAYVQSKQSTRLDKNKTTPDTNVNDSKDAARRLVLNRGKK